MSKNFPVDKRQRTFYALITKVSMCLCLMLTLNPGKSYGQTAPITASGLNTQVSSPSTLPSGQLNYDITGGTRVGTNLFHSFGEFNVPTNNIANFQNTLVNGVFPETSNILSRVTGPNGTNPSPSNIFGTIQTTDFGSANLFLMNPAGIVFGPNATLNVGGSVHFTTADYLKLADGAVFNAIPNSAADALLSTAPLAAFGFLGSNPAAITVQGSQLAVAEGKAISLVGGDITIQSGMLGDGTVKPAHLSAPGGQINIASVGSPGEVLLTSLATAVNVNGQSFTNMGNIALSEGSTLDVSANAAGTVRIRGGQLTIDNATISADTIDADGAPVAIDINVTGDMYLANELDPALTSRTSGTGNAGAINIQSQNLDAITSSSDSLVALIDTHTSGTGMAGSVAINAGNLHATNNSLFIDTGTAGTGHGGDVNIQGTNILIEGPAIATGNFRFGQLLGEDVSGSAGNLTLTATENLQIGPASTISTEAWFAEAGNLTLEAANILITGNSFVSVDGDFGGATINVTADHLTVEGTSLLNNNTVVDPGGDITINARMVDLASGGVIQTSTLGDGAAGNINITATERFTLNEQGNLQNRPTGVLSNSTGDFGNFGNSGSIMVTTPLLQLFGGAQLNTSTQSSGNAGNISITAQSITISGERPKEAAESIFEIGSTRGSGIYSRTVGSDFCIGPCGSAGTITIVTGALTLENGGTINTGTTNNGAAGNIIVNAANAINISGTMLDETPSSIYSRTVGQMSDAGSGGNITLTAGQSVTISDGAAVSASTSGPGNAGNVTIEGLASPTQSVLIDGFGSGVFTDTQGSGAGGNIFVNANSVTLQNGGTLSATTSGFVPEAAGGSITVNGDEINLTSGSSINASTFGAGNAGEISLSANDSVSLESGASILTQALFNFGGNGGPVTISAPTVRLQDSSIVTLAFGFGSELSTASAGSVTINAPTSVSLTNGTINSSIFDTAGNAGTIEITSPAITLLSASTISSAAFNSGFSPDGSPVGLPTDGNGGLVKLDAGQLMLSDGSQILTQTSGGGKGGDVQVFGLSGPGSVATDVTITSGAGIFTNTADIGSAGDISIHADRVMVTDGGQMQAATGGPGAGGTITIQATEQVTVSGETIACPTCPAGSQTSPSQLNTSSSSDGQAGNILIQTPNLTLADSGRIVASTFGSGAGGSIGITATNTVNMTSGSTITASSTGPADAGNIKINAGQQLTMQNSSITTEAAQAAGGNIDIQAIQQVTLDNSTISTSVLGGSGGGGNITIDPVVISLQNNSSILAQAVFGNGGSILLNTNLLLVDPSSVISASSEFGQSGTIQSPTSNLAGTVGSLPSSLNKQQALQAQRCAVLAEQGSSSFVIAGREMLPTEPGGWLTSPYAALRAGAGQGARGNGVQEEGVGQRAMGNREESPTIGIENGFTVSLRHFTPAGFLTQRFADGLWTGCRA